MLKIKEWYQLKEKNKFSINIENIKINSLICSIPKNILIKYLNNVEKNGRVIVCQKKEIIGLLIFETNPIRSINFLKKNLIDIIFGLLFKKNLRSKIILLKYFIDYIFFKKINLKNQIILLAVKKNFRNIGIGKKLINFLLKKKYQSICVTSDFNNYRAHNFYQKNNFFFYENINLGLRKIKVFKRFINI